MGRERATHFAFVLSAFVLALGGWSFLPASPPASNIDAALALIGTGIAVALPSITVEVVISPGAPGDAASDFWDEFERSVQRRVGSTPTIIFWRRRELDDGSEPPRDDGASFAGAYTLAVRCRPEPSRDAVTGQDSGQAAIELVVGTGRTAWAAVLCGEGLLVAEAKQLGRVFAAAMLRPTPSCFGGPRFCLNVTASSTPYGVHFELAVEATGRRWRFGNVEEALLGPALRRLSPSILLTLSSTVTHVGRLPTVVDAPGRRVVAIDDLSSALTHSGGAPSGFGPRGRLSHTPLLYFLAVLPESGELPLEVSTGAGHGANITNGAAASTVYVAEKGGTVTVLDVTDSGQPDATGVLPVSSFAPLASTFVRRLRGGLGLPPDPEDAVCGGPSTRGVTCRLLAVPGGLGFRAWEVDAILRDSINRLRDEVKEQIAALGSLALDGGFRLAVSGTGRSSCEGHGQQLALLLGAGARPGLAQEWRHASAVAAASGALSSALLGAATLVPLEAPFPAEHLAAIFLPMWMPLAAPLLTGLLPRARAA